MLRGGPEKLADTVVDFSSHSDDTNSVVDSAKVTVLLDMLNKRF